MPSNQAQRDWSRFLLCFLDHKRQKGHSLFGNCVSGTLMSSTGLHRGRSWIHSFSHCILQIQLWVLPHPRILGGHCRCGVYKKCTRIWIQWSCDAFSDRSHKNYLILNTCKTKKMKVDFQRSRPLLQPVKVCGVHIEVATNINIYVYTLITN